MLTSWESEESTPPPRPQNYLASSQFQISGTRGLSQRLTSQETFQRTFSHWAHLIRTPPPGRDVGEWRFGRGREGVPSHPFPLPLLPRLDFEGFTFLTKKHLRRFAPNPTSIWSGIGSQQGPHSSSLNSIWFPLNSRLLIFFTQCKLLNANFFIRIPPPVLILRIYVGGEKNTKETEKRVNAIFSSTRCLYNSFSSCVPFFSESSQKGIRFAKKWAFRSGKFCGFKNNGMKKMVPGEWIYQKFPVDWN